MVKRLRHHPFTVVSRVQIPVGSPDQFIWYYKMIAIFDGDITVFTVVSSLDSPKAHLKDFKYEYLKPYKGLGYKSQ